MSFILDALRKSEARRQREGAPGLHSPQPSPPPRRRRARWLVPVLLLVVVLVAAGSYLAGQRGAQPESALPSGVAMQQAAQPSEEMTSPLLGVPELAQDAGPGLTQAADEAQSELTDEVELAAAPAPRRDRRQPVRNVEEGRRVAAERQHSRVREEPPVPATEVVADLERRIARQQREQAAAEAAAESGAASRELAQDTTRDAGREADRELRQNASREAGSGRAEIRERREVPAHPEQRPGPAESRPAAPRPLSEGVAEYVHIWELPLSVRRSLPQLDLNIHVYSPEQSRSFVLINGTRYVEGDQIGDLEIVAIAREGAIMDYGTHRFLLESR